MPLFGNLGKKPTKVEPAKDPVTAIAVDDADLRRADQVVQRYLCAVGTTDAEIRAAELAISQAGGELSVQQSIELAARTGDPGLGRPWFWLAAVAREAQHRDDRDLVARISLFFMFWDTSIAPTLGPGDRFEPLSYGPPEAARVEVYTLAILTLPGMDLNTVIVSNQSGTMNVETVLLGCAQQALPLESHLDPIVAKMVKQICTPL
jgi:hypothetical protein